MTHTLKARNPVPSITAKRRIGLITRWKEGPAALATSAAMAASNTADKTAGKPVGTARVVSAAAAHRDIPTRQASAVTPAGGMTSQGAGNGGWSAAGLQEMMGTRAKI